MVQLPTEQAIGDLPDRLPRRGGVGGWQPGDLERGAQQLALGGQRLGTDVGMLAGSMQQQQNQDAQVKAESVLATSQIRTSQSLAQAQTPEDAAQHAQVFQDNVTSAASLIPNQRAQQDFILKHQPDAVRYSVGAQDRANGIVKDRDMAGYSTDSDDRINTALGTDDEGQRANIVKAQTGALQNLVNKGYIDQQKAVEMGRSWASDYGNAMVRKLIERAQPQYDPTTGAFIPGDTSKLRDLQKYFLNPYSAQPGDAAPGAVVPPTTDPAPVGGFNNAVARTLGFEGGAKVTDVNGAPVKWGINAADNPDVDLSKLTPQGAAAIYKQRYWDPINGDALAAQNPALAHVAFDTSVIAGADKAKQLLAQSGGDPQKFMSLRESFLNNLVASNPAKYGPYAKTWAQRDASLRADISQPAAGAPTAPTASNSYFIGDSIADGLKTAAGAQGNTLQGRSPQMVQNAIATIDPADLKGKSIYLSSGASNDPSSIASVTSQIESLKAKGVDPSQIRLLGVGDRPDFTAAKVNDQLAGIAKKEGVTFTGPLDPTNLRRNPNDNSDNGVHFADWNKGLAQVSGTNAMAQGGAPGGSFKGIYPNAPTSTGTVLDHVHPETAAKLGDEVTNAIDGIERKNQAQVGQYVKYATNDIQSRVNALTSGMPVGPNEDKVLESRYARDPNPEVQNAFSTYRLIKTNIDSYRGLPPQAVEADISKNEAAYNRAREANPGDPRLDQMKTVLDASRAYAKQYAAGAVKAPLETAVTQGILPNGTNAIDANSQGADWARRVSDAQTAAAALSGNSPGSVPVRYLQQAERASLRAIATQGGQPMVDMASHIVEGAGANAGSVFKEIGVDAPMFQKIGELAASGGDPLAIKEIAGVINAQRDPAGQKNLPIFKDTDLRKVEAGDPLGAALARFGPDYVGRTRTAANMLMTSGAAHDGWDLRSNPDTSAFTKDFVHKAYNRALGATYDPDKTQWGGIADQNARNWTGAAVPTLVPNNMKAADFSTVIGSIDNEDLKRMANPPVGGNGNPITARMIQDGLLEATPDQDGIFRGKYAVFTEGIRDEKHLLKNGKDPWMLDLADPNLDRSLRAKNPQSYQSATVPAAIPPPTPSNQYRSTGTPVRFVQPPSDRYKEAPGVVALTGAAETD